MAVGDVVRLRMVGNLHGHIWMSGVHFRYKTVLASAAMLAGYWQSTTMPVVIPACTEDVVFTDIFVEARFPALLETYQASYPSGTEGTLAGEGPPGQLAAAVDFRTGRKGGRYRGRQMLPFGSLGNVADGRWTGGSLTALDNYAAGLLAQYGPGGASDDFELVVYSPEKIANLAPGEKPRPGHIVTPVTTILRRDVCRTLRRRAIGQGI
jgi:hypothetical protein